MSKNDFKHLTEQAMGFDSQEEANTAALATSESKNSDPVCSKENFHIQNRDAEIMV